MASTTTLTLPSRTARAPAPQSDNPNPPIFSHAHYPPIERFVTIDGLLKSQAAEPQQEPLIAYPAHGVDDFEEHTAADVHRYTEYAADFYVRNGLPLADPASERAPVVAVLSPSSFEVILTLFALNRLGYTCLFLSTRLTAPAYARLLELCACKRVIRPPPFEQMVEEVRSQHLDVQGVPSLKREHWHQRADTVNPVPVSEADQKRRSTQIAWILHSSGSTGLPKPIFLTNLQCLANFRKSFGLRAFTASPLFHSGGLMEFGRAFYTRAPIYLGNHSLPVTSTNMRKAIKAAKPKLVVAVPYVLKLLAESEDGVQALASADIVLFNGSGCPDDLGDRLVAAGVNLVANYGATETGQLMTSFRGIPPTDNEWSYLRLWPPVANHTLMDEIAPGVFEAVGLDGLPSKGPSNSQPPYNDKNPPNSFRTADLFTRHPDPKKSNFYKYLSRLDDRITLVMGEKVLPLPIEGRIRQEEIVREAVVFGFQQAVPGVLIFRSNVHGLELSDDEYLGAVWPAVEAANAKAETFSQIMKELVVVKGPDVDYPKTDKGTFIRAQVYQHFDADIKAAYDRLEAASAGQEKLALEPSELEAWLLARFQQDLKIPLTDVKADIFAAGVDSLQTTRLWRTIKQKLDLGAGEANLSTNVVYEKGTVAALARHLYALRTGDTSVEFEDDEIQIMEDLIARYSEFVTHQPAPNLTPPAKHVVLLTGATGNLGVHIMVSLLRNPTVSEVCVLVRTSVQGALAQQDVTTRVLRALKSRNLPASREDCARLRTLASNLAESDLGLGPYTLQYLLENVTCVIHSAWAVNFNLGVRSFEDHIKGTQNLINLCLRSKLPRPAKFYFCSSVSTASSTSKPAIIPETAIFDLTHAQKTGYGRSKLVAEHITLNAKRQRQMDAQVLRIGQLSGASHSGIWNDTEAIPLMLRSALTVGALPALDERPSWLPVDVCADVCVHLALRSQDEATVPAVKANDTDEGLVYHVLNPQTFSWTDDLLPRLRALVEQGRYAKFDAVTPQEWLEKLSASDSDVEKNPSIKLIDFWRGKYSSAATQDTASKKRGDDDEGAVGLTFRTEKTVQACPFLGQIQQPVAEGLIEKYIDVWMKKWTAAAA